jgi:lantibiotic modifying enzyme
MKATNVQIQQSLNWLKNSLKSESTNRGHGYMTGKTGEIQFLFSYGEHNQDTSATDLAHTKLDELLSENITTFSYAEGLTGIGVLLLQLRADRFIDIDDDFFTDMDVQIKELLFSDLDKNNFDFFYGANGYMLYFLERNDLSLLNKIVDQYLNAVERMLSNENLLYSQVSHATPNGDAMISAINLGIPHGLCSTILCLVELSAKMPDFRDLIKVSLEKIFSIIIKGKNPDGYKSVYPSVLVPESPGGSRLAWCYGDLCLATALVSAGQCFENDEWLDEGRFVANKAAARKLDSSGIRDAGLCHGSAGIAAIFGKLGRQLSDETLFETEQYWIEETLEQLNNNKGTSYMSFSGSKDDWVVNNGLLEGSSGIGLMLLDKSGYAKNSWLRSFLL